MISVIEQPVAEVRQNFSDFVHRVSVMKDWVRLTRRGKPVAGAVPLGDFRYFEGPEGAPDEQGLETFEDILRIRIVADTKMIAEDRIEYYAENPDNRVHRITTADARGNLAEVLNRVCYGKQRIVLTRHGWDLLALIPPEALDRYLLIDEIEDEVDSKTYEEVMREIEREGTIPWEEVWKKHSVEQSSDE
jgi:antitoxin Phd